MNVDDLRARLLPLFGIDEARVEPFGRGLINTTFLVRSAERRWVLQRVNRIFDRRIHENIQAVTRALDAAGVMTPHLVPARDGAPCIDLDGEIWRLLTFVDGVSFDVVGSPRQARGAGELVARFHRALDRLPHAFVGLRVGVHDTPAHLARLSQAVATHGGHRLHGPTRDLAEQILIAAAEMPALPSVPDRTCHGDLKFNNILFAGATGSASEQALCLIDLDTVGPLSLAYELGDAWRSWCNRSGEDQPEAMVDLEIFAASLDGYRSGLGRALSDADRQGLLLGVEWVSLELAARFAADALNEAYFGWDPARFATRGEHNLLRARGQFSLHRAFVQARDARTRLLV